jgi:hypothetical protein
VVMWRSDPPCSTMDFNNWFNVGGMTPGSSYRVSANSLDRQKLAPVYTIQGIDEKT